MFDYFELLIGFIATLITAYAGYQKYLDEKQFNHYKDNIKNLFSPNKDEILAAIATLGVYKNRRSYKKSTTNTLLNLIYTQLDYDISNAIIGVLAQTVKRNDFIYIAERLIEINRNFFVQTYPLNQRQNDIEINYKNMEKYFKDNFLQEGKENEILNEWKTSSQNKWLDISSAYYFQLKWHKLITADVLAMILNKATKTGLTKGINLKFYQNDFNFSQFNGITLEKCSINHTAIGTSSLQDIKLLNLSEIKNSSFVNSSLDSCVFTNGNMSGCSFAKSLLENCIFQDIIFNDTFFISATLNNCSFINCKGLESENFFGADISSGTHLPESINQQSLPQITYEMVENKINSSLIPDYRKKELLDYLNIIK